MKANKPKTSADYGILVATGTTNLYRNSVTGIYYLRTKINGKPTCRSLETDIKTTAVELLAQKLSELRTKASQGIKLSDNTTFGDCLDRFFAEQARRVTVKEITASTLLSLTLGRERIYKLWGKNIREQAIRKFNIGSVISKHDSLHAKKSATFVNTIKNIFVGAFQVAVKDKVISENPALAISRKSTKIAPRAVPTGEELAALLNHIASKENHDSKKFKIRDLIQFLCFFGPRIDEARNVLKTDVVLTRNVVRFRKTKNGFEREVPISPQAKPLIERLLVERANDEKLLGATECFGTLKSACKALGLPRYGHHTFRHYFASTALIATGCDFFTVAIWLGHRDGGKLLATTYAHLNDKHSQKQAAKLDHVFAPVSIPAAAKQIILNGQTYSEEQLTSLLKYLPAF